MIKVKSLNCPHCGDTETIELTEPEWDSLRKRDYVQDALSRFPPDVRERFITGICGDCWNKIFGGDE